MTITDLPEKTHRHLELEYSFNEYPNDQTKSALAQLTGLATHEVSEWFEKKRQNFPFPEPIRAFNDSSAQERSRENAKARLGEPIEVNPRNHDDFGFYTSGSRGDLSRFSLGYERSAPVTNTRLNIPRANIDRTTSESVIPINWKHSQADANVNPSSDGTKDEDKSGWPGCFTFPVSDAIPKVPPRRRQRFALQRRVEVAAVRKVGACALCRSKKTRCFHIYDRLDSKTPSVSSASTSSNPLKLPLESPSSAGKQDEVFALEVTADCVITTGDTAKEAHHTELSEGSKVLSTNDTNQLNYANKTTSSAHAPLPDVCSECGFKPDGDPRWHKSNLVRHMRVHRDQALELRCTFPDCVHTYRRSDNLRAHIRKAHGNVKLGDTLLKTESDRRARAERLVKALESGQNDPVATDAGAEMPDAGDLIETGSSISTIPVTIVFSDGTA